MSDNSKPGINNTSFILKMSSSYWSGIDTSYGGALYNKSKIKKSNMIAAKCALLNKMDLSMRTTWGIERVCYALINDYKNWKWKTSNMEETMKICDELLKTNEEDNLIIVIEILKKLERK